MSPFFANTGRHPTGVTGIRTTSANTGAENFAKHIKDIHKQAKTSLTKAAEDMKRFYDCHAEKLIEFKAEDKVFLDRHHLKTIRPTKKLDNKWFRPFDVLEKIGASVYKLRIPRDWRNKDVHPVFNKVLLKPAVEPEFESQRREPLPPPVLINDKEEYKVAEILDSQVYGRWKKLQYLVKWVGYEDPTWEPAVNVENAKEVVEEFHKKHPGAPRQLDILPQALHQIFTYTTTDRSCGWSGCPTLRGV